jgi:prepilin-type N-terminal cleavage/methylation domain-containing protein
MKRSFKSAFTLVELLIVIALLGMLATVSITGYSAATRGMEERGARDSVISLIRLAQQRALIDNVPTAVIFSNQLLRHETEAENKVVVGTAVAIRMMGRISFVDGNYICDEYADWDKSYPDYGSNKDPSIYLYNMRNIGGGITQSRSEVTPYTTDNRNWKGYTDEFMVYSGYSTNVVVKCLTKRSGASWNVGDPYGSEIGSLQLPKNYVFDSKLPTDEEPVHVMVLSFNPANVSLNNSSFSMQNVTISALRPGSGGSLSPVKIHSLSSTDISQR